MGEGLGSRLLLTEIVGVTLAVAVVLGCGVYETLFDEVEEEVSEGLLVTEGSIDTEAVLVSELVELID